jgi:hypothetical protein
MYLLLLPRENSAICDVCQVADSTFPVALPLRWEEYTGEIVGMPTTYVAGILSCNKIDAVKTVLMPVTIFG